MKKHLITATAVTLGVALAQPVSIQAQGDLPQAPVQGEHQGFERHPGGKFGQRLHGRRGGIPLVFLSSEKKEELKNATPEERRAFREDMRTAAEGFRASLTDEDRAFLEVHRKEMKENMQEHRDEHQEEFKADVQANAPSLWEKITTWFPWVG